MTKRMISGLLCIALLLTLLPANVFAASAENTGAAQDGVDFIGSAVRRGKCGDNLEWTYDESDKTLVIYGTGDMNDSKGADYPLFYVRSSVQKVVIEYGVTSIGDYAFSRFNSLTSVTIPDSVKKTGKYAFSECTSLESVTIPNSITELSDYMFYKCSSLASVTLPESITSIGNGTFSECTSLTAAPIPRKTKRIGGNAFSSCRSITSAALPEGLLSIGFYAFGNCSELQSIKLPGSLTRIDAEAFYFCSGLTSVTIPGSVKSIADSAFSCCRGLKSVVISEGVISIGRSAFNFCDSLVSVAIPDSVKNIGESAFSLCYSLKSITIPDGVTNIENSMFRSCYELSSVVLPDSIKNIGDSAFALCSSLTSFTVPGNVISLGKYIFSNCVNLASLRIPKSVASIASYFLDERCTLLTDIYYEGSKAEWDKINIDPNNNECLFSKNMHYLGSTPAVVAQGSCGTGLTWTLDGEGTLRISGTGNMKNTTANGDLWGGRKSAIKTVIIEDGAVNVGNYAFAGCGNLASVTIPGSAADIGDGAFRNCVKLTYIAFPKGVVSVGNGTFYGCSGLNKVSFPLYFESIGDEAFSGCSSLIEIRANSNIRRIGDNAFYGCSGIVFVSINHMEEIGQNAFFGCTSLPEIIISLYTVSIGSRAFGGCSSLEAISVSKDNPNYTSVDGILFDKQCSSIICFPAGKDLKSYEIPESVTDIGDSAFYGCSGLTAVTISDSMASIGGYAFYGCSGLKDVYYGGSEEEWGKINIGSGNSCLLNARIHYTDKPVSVPQNVKAVVDTATTMKVSWDAVPNATKYVVYRKEGSADWKAFVSTTATSITLKTNLKHGYNYRFRIYAKNAAYTSAGSEVVLCKFVPWTPTGLTISSVSVGQATIKWDAIPNIKGYCVYYKRADDSGYTYAGATTATSKTITGLTTGARYAFKIRAYVPATAGIYAGQNIFSDYCKYVSCEITPAAPTGLKIASTAAGKATITWSKVPDVYAYCVYYKRADDAGYTYFGATTATSKTITGLTTGARYAFKVRAYVKAADGPKAGQNVFGPYCNYVSGSILAN